MIEPANKSSELLPMLKFSLTRVLTAKPIKNENGVTITKVKIREIVKFLIASVLIYQKQFLLRNLYIGYCYHLEIHKDCTFESPVQTVFVDLWRGL